MDNYNPTSRYRRNHSQQFNRNRRHPPYHLINAHFENIQMLANIIQESHSLLMPPQSPPEINRTIPLYDRLNHVNNVNNLSYMVHLDQFLNRLPNVPEQSYTTQTIDVSGGDVSFNADVLYFNEYSTIQNPINEACPITREAFYMNQRVSMIRRCRHIFNCDALHMWLRSNQTCPTCRGAIRGESS